MRSQWSTVVDVPPRQEMPDLETNREFQGAPTPVGRIAFNLSGQRVRAELWSDWTWSSEDHALAEYLNHILATREVATDQDYRFALYRAAQRLGGQVVEEGVSS